MRPTGLRRILGAGAILLAATLRLSPQQQSQRISQFENSQVKVWKSVILPNAPLSMHRHDHPRVIIALSGGTMKFVQQSGASETQQWETGKAYWLDAMPPGQLHSDVNGGKKPIEVMVVELEQSK